MAEIVIVNPSSNLLSIGKELKYRGKSVEFVTTKDVPIINPSKVFYFYDGMVKCYADEGGQSSEKIDFIMSLKSSIFAKWGMLKFNKHLISQNPELACGSLKDLAIIKAGAVRPVNVKEYQEFTDIKAVAKQFSEAKIYTSVVHESSSHKICHWETELELDVTFAKDYFVVATSKSYVEAFVQDGKLVTISKGDDHIEKLSTNIPLLKKYSFKKAHEASIKRNYNPWIIKSGISNVYLMNDYSYGCASVAMPMAWYDKVAQRIESEKK